MEIGGGTRGILFQISSVRYGRAAPDSLLISLSRSCLKFMDFLIVFFSSFFFFLGGAGGGGGIIIIPPSVPAVLKNLIEGHWVRMFPSK